MSHRISPDSRATADITRALRRAAKRALELGMQTGTPVWVMKKGKLVDLTKELSASKKARKRRAASTKVSK
ncbi:MAG TPA: hypothetical protein VN844_01440 [Pyrinomonadaceae bacterium]|nr:hypothetical protein [Pyrinomonadaceae bacterium]